MKNIIFFGSGYYVIPIVSVLKDQGLKLVVTNEPEGELLKFLRKEKIPYLYSKLQKPKEFEHIKQAKPDIGVLASYGAFIPQAIIDLFPMGILNIHPSLLPKYKGPSPIQYTILNGDTVCGISIILLDNQIDHGPIVKQKEFPIPNDKNNAKNLTELAFLKGADMLKEIIQNINNNLPIKSTPQRIENESWTKKIEKMDGKINLQNPPNPVELDRKIRAFYPWPGVYLNASLGKTEKSIKLLPEKMIQVEGKNPMSFKDFINGYGDEAKTILNKLQLL